MKKQSYSESNIEKPIPLSISLSDNENLSEPEDVSLEDLLNTNEDNIGESSKNIKSSSQLTQDDAVKKALAEISFLEGSETLEKGDLNGAISKYKDAINYFPNKVDYYIKLIEAFKKDSKYKSEQNILLGSIAKKFPDSPELTAILNEQNPQNKAKANKIESKSTKLPAKLLEAAKENEVVPAPTKSLKPTINDKRTSHLKKLKNKVVASSETKLKSPYGKLLTVLVLISLTVATIWGLNNSLKETIIETAPITPESQSNLLANQLYFCWTSSTDKVDYVLQIEQEGKPVLELYTREKFYSLSQEEASAIKDNSYCTWRAIPISPKLEQLKYKTVDGQFMVVKELSQ